MGILDTYSAYEVRDIWRDDTNSWPEDFIRSVNDVLASDLLDQWLESHSDTEYRERVREIIEDETYGYEDEDGNEMLDFNPSKDNDGQMRLFE
jgi:hypothetical protein